MKETAKSVEICENFAKLKGGMFWFAKFDKFEKLQPILGDFRNSFNFLPDFDRFLILTFPDVEMSVPITSIVKYIWLPLSQMTSSTM